MKAPVRWAVFRNKEVNAHSHNPVSSSNACSGLHGIFSGARVGFAGFLLPEKILKNDIGHLRLTSIEIVLGILDAYSSKSEKKRFL